MASQTPSDDRRIVCDGGVDEDAVESLSEYLGDVEEQVGTIAESMSELQESFSDAAEAAENLEG